MRHHLVDQSYGKSAVRLSKVTRDGGRHSVSELSIDIELDGDFERAYIAADNRLVIPTDTMKNTVYVLARQHDFKTIESFGQLIAAHFLTSFDHVSKVTVRMVENIWKRISVGGSEHPHAFIGGGGEYRTAVVSRDRSGEIISSGLAGLAVLKTTGSGFSDFLRDEYTLLRETADRVLATTIAAEWRCGDGEVDWSRCRQRVREAVLKTFAEQESPSVQHTLHAMALAVFDECDAVRSITLKMPNEHRLLVDLEPFGMPNQNEVFLPIGEPFGVISATVERGTGT